jgi:hypothetical protein
MRFLLDCVPSRRPSNPTRLSPELRQQTPAEDTALSCLSASQLDGRMRQNGTDSTIKEAENNAQLNIIIHHSKHVDCDM